MEILGQREDRQEGIDVVLGESKKCAKKNVNGLTNKNNNEYT